MKPIRIVCLLFVALLISAGSCSHSPEEWIEYSLPENEGINPDSLKVAGTHAASMATDGRIPGAVLLVARNGKIVYTEAFGYADIEAETKLTTNQIFRIASMTKPVVSVAIMQLYEAGKLDMNDPVSKYIPSFENPTVLLSFDREERSWLTKPAESDITIHHLLTHTSGIGYGFASPRIQPIYAIAGIPDLATTDNVTIEEKMELLGTLPLLHNPGERFTYGLSTDVLGRVVEVASGMPLDDYIYNYITSPLQMHDTRFFYTTDMAVRFAGLYSYNIRRRTLVSYNTGRGRNRDFATGGSQTYFSGGSGLSSTATDYFIFCQAILNGGEYKGVRILSEENVVMMTENKLAGLNIPARQKFGYGFGIEEKADSENPENSIITHLGWAGAFGTWFTINPSEEMVAIILTQTISNPFERELTTSFKNAVNASITSSYQLKK